MCLAGDCAMTPSSRCYLRMTSQIILCLLSLWVVEGHGALVHLPATNQERESVCPSQVAVDTVNHPVWLFFSWLLFSLFWLAIHSVLVGLSSLCFSWPFSSFWLEIYVCDSEYIN